MILTIEGESVAVSKLSLEQWRRFMAEFMKKNPNSARAWDIMGCVRGPDSPSERPNMGSTEFDRAYGGRRKRKRETVEVLREAMFYGVVGGAARSHKGDCVTLPPSSVEDHFDKHVYRAASALGIPVKRKKEESHEE